jgi:hypothetical protein
MSKNVCLQDCPLFVTLDFGFDLSATFHCAWLPHNLMPCRRNKMFNLIFERSFREFFYLIELLYSDIDLSPFWYNWYVSVASSLLILVLLSTFEAGLKSMILGWAMRLWGDIMFRHLILLDKILTQKIDFDRLNALGLFNTILFLIFSCIEVLAIKESYKHSFDSFVSGFEIGLDAFQGLDWILLRNTVCRSEAAGNCLERLLDPFHGRYLAMG